MGAQVTTYSGVRQTARTALATIIAIPLVAYYLYFSVAFDDGGLLPRPGLDWQAFFRSVVPTVEAALVYFAWLILQAALFIVLPGRVVDGLPLEDGSKLRYKLNGLGAMLVSLAILGLGQLSGLFSLSWIHDNFGALLTVITIFSFAFAGFVHWWGRSSPGRAVPRLRQHRHRLLLRHGAQPAGPAGDRLRPQVLLRVATGPHRLGGPW